MTTKQPMETDARRMGRVPRAASAHRRFTATRRASLLAASLLLGGAPEGLASQAEARPASSRSSLGAGAESTTALSGLAHTPALPTVDDAVSIRCNARFPADAVAPTVTAYYRFGATGPFAQRPMNLSTGDLWHTVAPVPAGRAGPVEYYVQAAGSAPSNVTARLPAAGPATWTVTDPSGAAVDPRQNAPCTRRGGLSIAEIMYHPPDRDDGLNLEYVEILNTEPVPAEIGGCRLSGDVAYTFPTGTVLGAGARAVVAADPQAVETALPAAGVFGPWTGRLPDRGGTVRLRNPWDAVLVDVEYDDAPPWPVAADGAGCSLVQTRPDYGERDPRAWSPSERVGGSPGYALARRVDALSRIVINEWLAHADPPTEDAIELYNHGTAGANLSGCVLSTRAATNRFVIPPGTLLPAGRHIAFHASQLGFDLDKAGDRIVLSDPTGARVLDAVTFGAQASATASGRTPDGALDWTELASSTFGAANDRPSLPDVVLNEIMFHPLSGLDDDEYVELHNRGAATADLSNWRFIAGIDYRVPAGTTVAPGGFLVVAKNMANLLARYPQLNAANTVGDYAGVLSDSGERLALARPDDPNLPDQDFVVVDEVTYGDGWAQWTDGGGSSLELVDPRSDNRHAMNWAGSDETRKTVNDWTHIEQTDVLSSGLENGGELEFLLQRAGECLIDDVQVTQGSVTCLAANFESDPAGLKCLGTHSRSSIETAEGFGGSGRSLHIRATDRGDLKLRSANEFLNHLALPLNPAPAAGAAGTIRAKARWLCGSPYLLLNVQLSWIEAAVRLNTPPDLGTPGLTNSRFRPNAGPAISGVRHEPVLPAANQAVVVSARIDDPDGIRQVWLRYRVDPAFATNTLTLRDDGAGGDALAGDGLYAATIPGQPSGKLVAFWVEATDAAAGSATTRFPGEAPVNAPALECLVRFGHAPPSGAFGSYFMWVSQPNRARWYALGNESNEPVDMTLACGNDRAVYNAGARFRGLHRGANGYPEDGGNAYSWTLPKSERVLGQPEIKIDACGQGGGDGTRQLEHHIFWMARQIGIAASHVRFVRVFCNGNDRGIQHDLQTAGNDFAASWFDDADPIVFKHTCDEPFSRYVKADGSLKQARYRLHLRKSKSAIPNDDFSTLFRFVDALTNAIPRPFEARVGLLADVRSWASYFATACITGNPDIYGRSWWHNAYYYLPAHGRGRAFMADLDLALRDGTGSGTLFPGGLVCTRMFSVPSFRREYWRFIKDFAEGPMSANRTDPFLDAWYAAFLANGWSVNSPAAIKDWYAARRTYLLTVQLPTVAARFAITSNGGVDFSSGANPVTLAGTAPVDAETVRLNGIPYPVTWTSVTNWQARIVPAPGVNVLTFSGYRRDGNPLSNAVDSIAVTYTGNAVPPEGWIAINEIMYNPPATKGAFVELLNRHPTATFDLGGMRLAGVDATFAPGTLLGPGACGVVAEDPWGYAAAYTNAEAILAAGNGTLDRDGEWLRLLRPVAGGSAWTVVDEVRYAAAAPWPVEANGAGPSLQLVDAANDNACPGNWRTDARALCTPGAPNSVRAVRPPFPALRLNEVQPRNLTTKADSRGEFDPWVEVLNASTPNVLAVEVHQASPDGGDLAFSASLGFAQNTTTQDVVLLNAGSVWSCLDDGSDAGTAWREPGFDDTHWKSGPARLGYEDGAVTVLNFGPDPANKIVAYYVRARFTVERPQSLVALRFRYQRDDGVILYLNGVEVVRDGMPAGPVDFRTLASISVGGADETRWVEASVNPSLLRPGINTVAAELHQASPASSDLGFDLAVVGSQVRFGTVTEVIRSNATWRVLDSGADPAADWVKPWFDDSTWRTGPAPLGFGNGNEATALETNRLVCYFRHRIDLDGATVANPVLRLLCDDGAVAYLNGIEIFRTNLPPGDVTSSTRALRPVEGAAETNVAECVLPPSLFHPGPESLSLSNLFLTHTETNLTEWAFPAGGLVGPRQALVVWCDGEPQESTPTEPHANFALHLTNGWLALVWHDAGELIVLDYLAYGAVGPDRSIGPATPDRAAHWVTLYYPTPGSRNDLRPPPIPVRVTEIMYNPPPPTASEAAAGFSDGEDFEFIELRNVGTQTVDLAQVRFSRGIEFAFSNAAVRGLAPGLSAVLVGRVDAFTNRYGAAVRVAGQYSGRLSNAGERLRLETVYGEAILDFTYDDAWYPQTDGQGDSLVAVNPDAPLEAWSTKENWLPSGRFGGTPGDSTNGPAEAGIRLDESGAFTLVSEAGLSDTFTVALRTPPSATVTVRLAVARGQLWIEPAELVFSTPNWSQVQTVTVHAVDDAEAEPDPHGDTILPRVSSADPFYDALPLPPVQVAILDNDDGPSVTVQATVPTASKAGGPPGEFTLRRSGPVSADLPVLLGIAGTAAGGVDYQAIPTSVTVQAGTATLSIPVVPLRDHAAEDTETVAVAVQAGPGYVVAFPSNATVSIESAPMDRWRLSVFGASANTAQAQDTADFDGDGVRNLMEYVLDLSPTNARAGGEFTARMEGDGSNRFLTVYYTRRTNLTDATLWIEISTNLPGEVWFNGAALLRETTLATNESHTLIRAQILPYARDPALRLKATRP